MSHALKVLVFFLVLCFSLAASSQGTRKKQIDFVYFGAHDCPSCVSWKAIDLPKLKGSSLFGQVRFTEVVKGIRSPIPSAYWFPEEIKHLREPIAEKIKGAGSPMFAILTDGQVVASWKGTRKSPEEILSIIEKQALPSSGTTSNPTVPTDAVR